MTTIRTHLSLLTDAKEALHAVAEVFRLAAIEALRTYAESPLEGTEYGDRGYYEVLRAEASDRASALESGTRADVRVHNWSIDAGVAGTISDYGGRATVGSFLTTLESTPGNFTVTLRENERDLGGEVSVSVNWDAIGVALSVDHPDHARASALQEALRLALEEIAQPWPEEDSTGDVTTAPPVVFLGHGGDRQWMELRDAIGEGDIEVLHFEGVPNAGETIQGVIDGYLQRATVGVFLLTGEDTMASGAVRARQNVIHEIGLFQGRLGWGGAIVVVEEGTEVPSNLAGIVQVRFPRDKVGMIGHTVVQRIRQMQRDQH